MVRLVNLLMRDEGPDNANEEEEMDVDDPIAPTSNTILVTAEGKAVNRAVEPATSLQGPRVMAVDSEDEDEMLIEV